MFYLNDKPVCEANQDLTPNSLTIFRILSGNLFNYKEFYEQNYNRFLLLIFLSLIKTLGGCTHTEITCGNISLVHVFEYDEKEVQDRVRLISGIHSFLININYEL